MRKGHTLIEVVVATNILSLTLLFIFSSLSLNMKINEVIDKRLDVILLGEEELQKVAVNISNNNISRQEFPLEIEKDGLKICISEKILNNQYYEFFMNDRKYKEIIPDNPSYELVELNEEIYNSEYKKIMNMKYIKLVKKNEF